MRSAPQPPTGGVYSRRFSNFRGLFFDEFDAESAWIREAASIQLPPLDGAESIVIRGECRHHPDAQGIESPLPGLDVAVNGASAPGLPASTMGRWEISVPASSGTALVLTLRLTGVASTNFLAWLGRISRFGPLQRFRRQNKNRQLRIRTIETSAGEIIFNFSQRDHPYSSAFARRHAKLGLNIVGFLTADLGVGESARCMVRAADAAAIPTALVPLKLNCKNRLGDSSYATRLQDRNPHEVNVIHIDPPAARDIDHHHGPAFRAGKYNVGYFAWELPEFPDAWMPSFDYFDEIWCPSDFTSSAVALKSPVPVLTMPHAISFQRPTESGRELRSRFGLPPDAFLFLTLFDLNSYAARKNPGAAIEAFRLADLARNGSGLVIKVQNVAGNAAEFATLRDRVANVPGILLLTDTLSRTDVYALEAACDCFVSLHRSEGFGLAVAECMFLGKPVIVTDWSATAEYVSTENGCPTRARTITLETNYGPYPKGSVWADPNIDHAAEYMRRLHSDPAFAARLGSEARKTIENRFAPAVIGGRYRRRLECIAGF